MTIKDLYEISVKNNFQDYEIYLQYQDGGGVYCGNTNMTEYELIPDYKEIILS